MSAYRPYLLAEVRRNSAEQRFTVVSTFAGGGGSSTGYRLAGGKVVLANEVDPSAASTYRLNYPDTPLVNLDIRKITRKGGRKYVLDFFAEHGISLGDLDILDGSPPCTTFSIASAGRGKDKIERKNIVHANVQQSRIGMLVHDYIYLVNCLKPRVFIMENVVPSKKSPVFSDAIARARKHGYLIQWQTVKAKECAVAQHRERLITIGVRSDLAAKLRLKTPSDLAMLFPSGGEDVTLRSALNGVVNDPDEVEVWLDSCRLSASYEQIRAIPKGGPKHLKVGDVIEKWNLLNADFSLLRAGWETTCPTLTCRGQQLGISGVHHPDYDRKFTITEMKRIMSLPDDFQLSGSLNDKATRIGNMVPPLMTYSIAKSVYEKVLARVEKAPFKEDQIG
jgi:DNA (cytosine-5)-methyltransferase 1